MKQNYIYFTQNQSQTGYLAYINILKVIAVLIILFVHTGQLFKTWPLYDACKLGQLGCQCFFMVSGFTLSLSYERGGKDLLPFFKRRFMAIAPGYYGAIVLYCICSMVVIQIGLPSYWSQDMSIVGWLSNIIFIHGLVPEHINRVVPGGWYIGTTVLLYILFPLIKKVLDVLGKYRIGYVAFVTSIFSFPLIMWITLHYTCPQVALENNSYMFFCVLTQLPSFVMGGGIT